MVSVSGRLSVSRISGLGSHIVFVVYALVFFRVCQFL